MRSTVVAVVSGVLLAMLLYGVVEMLTPPQTPTAIKEEEYTILRGATVKEPKAQAAEVEGREKTATPTWVDAVIQADSYYTASIIFIFSLLLASTAYLVTHRRVYG